MKIVRTEITPQFNSPVSIVERDDLHFRSPFHFHPEIELVYIIEGSGKRIIGDKLEEFSEGEVVLIGSNLPHVWISDEKQDGDVPKGRARSIVAYFDREIFGKAFYQLKEAKNINKLFDVATRGIKITGNKRNDVAASMENLVQKTGLEKILYLIEILHRISNMEEIEFINNDTYSGCCKKSETDRLSKVFKYVNDNFRKNIKLKDAAEIVHLSPASFCRLFKDRMNKNFVDYLQEVRISHACRYLMDTDHTVAEIAYNTGFNNISNFNKQFKHKTGFRPKEYRYNSVGNISNL